MYKVDAECRSNWHEQRREDEECGSRVEEAAGHEQDDVDDEQEQHHAASRQIIQAIADGDIQACPRQDVGEQAGRGRDEHDDCRRGGRIHQDIVQVANLERLVDEEADEQAIDDGYGCCLGRCEDTAVDATEDDQRHQQPPERFAEGSPAHQPRGLRDQLDIHFPTEPECCEDKPKTHHEARDETCDEQGTDGCIGNGTVDDEGDGWRDDDTDGARCRHEAAENAAG